MFKNHLKTALRNIKRNKAYSILNILGLSVGIASSILILSWVYNEMGYDRFHKNGENIYRVILQSPDGDKSNSTCGALVPALKNDMPEIKEATRLWYPNPWQLYNGSKNIERIGNYADPSFFNMFSFKFIQGNAKTALPDAHSIVLTESVARSLFEDNNAFGKTIYIRNRDDNKEAFTVTGVIKDIPTNSHIQFDFLFSFELLKTWYRPDFGEQWKNYSFSAYLMLGEKSNIQSVTKKMNECYQRNKDNKVSLSLQPLYDVYLDASIRKHKGGDAGYLKIFTGVAFVILFIACVNYINLATAYSSRRRKEIGMRKVIGATRSQICLSQLSETLIFSICALAAASFIVYLIQPLFNSLTGTVVDVNYLDPVFIVVIVAVVLLTGLLASIYPALYLSGLLPVHSFKGKTGTGKKSATLRTVLIVLQFALTSIIIIATLVTADQMNFIKTKNLGFDKDNLIYTWTSGLNNDAIRRELHKNPNIINVAASGTQLDFIGRTKTINKWEGNFDSRSVNFGIMEVGYDFADTYGIKVSDGHFYSQQYPSDLKEAVVINRSAAQAMHMNEPIGKTINIEETDKRIVGVVEDFHFESLHSSITPLIMMLYTKQLPCLGIRVKNENIARTLSYIKTVIANIEPDYVLKYKFLDEQIDNLYSREKRRLVLLSAFSVISIILSCMGLFGLISYTAEQRTKEIGVRKVLGASVSGIVYIISKDFLKWILVANVIAWPIGWYIMNKWLQDFAYRVNLTIWPFLLSGFLALMISLLTVNWKVIRAALANPVESLKYE
jgi:ABC-type antimicrobial peptide transport system permease subunit